MNREEHPAVPDHYASKTEVAVAGALIAIVLSANAITQRAMQYLESQTHSVVPAKRVYDHPGGRSENSTPTQDHDYSGLEGKARSIPRPY